MLPLAQGFATCSASANIENCRGCSPLEVNEVSILIVCCINYKTLGSQGSSIIPRGFIFINNLLFQSRGLILQYWYHHNYICKMCSYLVLNGQRLCLKYSRMAKKLVSNQWWIYYTDLQNIDYPGNKTLITYFEILESNLVEDHWKYLYFLKYLLQLRCILHSRLIRIIFKLFTKFLNHWLSFQAIH